MKKILKVSGYLSVVLLAVACQNPLSTTPVATATPSFTGANTTVVPGQFTSNVPGSLVTGGVTRGLGPAVGNTYSIERIKEVTQRLKAVTILGAVRLLMADTVISQNNLQPGPNVISKQTLTIDQAFLDKLAAILPKAIEDGASVEIPKLGEVSKVVPDFVYNTITGDPIYASIFSVAAPVGHPEVPALILKWSADKKSTYMSLVVNNAPISDSLVLTYDATLKLSRFVHNFSDGQVTQVKILTLKEDPASTANGAFVTFDSTLTDASKVISISATGYADDKGGVLNSLVRTQDGVTLLPAEETHKEGFGKTGAMTFAHNKKADGTESDDTNLPEVAPTNPEPQEVQAANDLKETDKQKMADNSSVNKDVVNARVFIQTLTGATVGTKYVVFDVAKVPATLTGLSPATSTVVPLGFAEVEVAGSVKIELLKPLTATTQVNLYTFVRTKTATGETVDLTLVAGSPLTLTVQ